MFKSILAALAGLVTSGSQAAQVGKSLQTLSVGAPVKPYKDYSLPVYQRDSYKTTGTRKAMRAAKKRQGIKAKLPK